MELWHKIALGAAVGLMVATAATTGVTPIAHGKSNEPLMIGSRAQVAQLLGEYERYLSRQGVNTNWFSPDELTYLRRWGRYAIPPKHRWDEMAITLKEVVQPLRAKYGPMKIKNGYRPRAYNDQDELAADNSRHIWNQGVDFELIDAPAERRVALALDLARLYKSPRGERLRPGPPHFPRRHRTPASPVEEDAALLGSGMTDDDIDRRFPGMFPDPYDEYDDSKDHNRCPDCKGSGWYIGFTDRRHCPTCEGSGWR